MSSFSITHIHGRQIIDSRGNPTVEADVYLEDGSMGRAAVPSGASTGSGEALELRDGGKLYGGKGVSQAVAHINQELSEALVGSDASNQASLDRRLIELDGTPNKARFGANAILAISLATAKAVAVAKKIPLHRYIAEIAETPRETLPMPMMNVMNGGQHAAGSTDVQEYMIIPQSAPTIADAVRMGTEVFHSLATILKKEGYGTTVGDEGGYAPAVKHGNREPLELISQAVELAGYVLGKDIVLALDVASSELYYDEAYHLQTEGKTLSSDDLIQWYQDLTGAFPIVSIEDGLDENDWDGWKNLTHALGGDIQLVGDDLLVTNTKLLEKAIEARAANAILIKPNQIGSLSETIAAVQMAHAAGWRTIMSHRSGETEDSTIAHLAVGLGTGQIKTGSLSRSDRIAKYNELIRIAEESPELRLTNPFVAL